MIKTGNAWGIISVWPRRAHIVTYWYDHFFRNTTRHPFCKLTAMPASRSI